jgi:hypothetical protein
MSHLEKHLALLKVLATSDPKLSNVIIKNVNNKLVCVICEIAKNILLGNVPLDDSTRKKLLKYKEDLRKLSKRDKKMTTKSRKRIILKNNQKGGFLPLLIAPILSIAAEVIASKVLNK